VNIHFHLRQGRLQVGRDVSRAMALLERFNKTVFGRDVQHLLVSLKKIRFLFEVQPD